MEVTGSHRNQWKIQGIHRSVMGQQPTLFLPLSVNQRGILVFLTLVLFHGKKIKGFKHFKLVIRAIANLIPVIPNFADGELRQST